MTALFQQVAQTAELPSRSRRRAATPAEAPSDVKRRQPSGPAALAMATMARNRRTAVLSRVVETEILPRLAVARGAAAGTSALNALATEADTAEFVRLLLMKDAAGATAFIEVLQLRGAAPADLYLGILTQAARRLGELWEDDRADFTEVTISMGRLQQIVRTLSPALQVTAVRRAHPETVLLVPAPDGQHTFGLVILAEFFHREGWHVVGGPMPYGNDGLAGLVRDSWVDVAGFSIGSVAQLEPLSKCIQLARRLSLNRDLGIMVGGPLLLLRPELVARVGADMTAIDAESAVRQASGLLAIRTAAD